MSVHFSWSTQDHLTHQILSKGEVNKAYKAPYQCWFDRKQHSLSMYIILFDILSSEVYNHATATHIYIFLLLFLQLKFRKLLQKQGIKY